MRTLIFALTLTIVAFAGCFGNGDGDGDGTPTDAPTGGTQTDTGTGGNGTPGQQTYDCDVTVGTSVISLSTPAGNIGGCSLYTIESGDRRVVSLDPPAMCHIEVDENDDGQADAEASEGATYSAPASFIAFCDAGSTGGTASITLETV